MLDAKQCLELLAGIRSLSVATVDAVGGPQVRILDMVLHDGLLYFVTARGKDVYTQLMADDRVGIVGMTKDWKMIRMSAHAVHKERSRVGLVLGKDKSINDVYPGESSRILEAFCVERGTGELFDLGGTPVRREDFAFGGAGVVEKGYSIGGECTECGICAQSCPQQCIVEGTPFLIRQGNCLHCGLCREVCPADAVGHR